MQTYLGQLSADEARIQAETSGTELGRAERAGRYQALASFYAGAADHEAAKHQRTMKDAFRLVSEYMAARALDDEMEAIVADLLDAICAGPLSEVGFSMERASIQEAVDDLRYIVKRRQERREEDLDAPAAAASDEAYDRKI